MGGLLWTFIGPNQLQLHARMACLPDMKRLAALFVQSATVEISSRGRRKTHSSVMRMPASLSVRNALAHEPLCRMVQCYGFAAGALTSFLAAGAALAARFGVQKSASAEAVSFET